MEITTKTIVATYQAQAAIKRERRRRRNIKHIHTQIKGKAKQIWREQKDYQNALWAGGYMSGARLEPGLYQWR